MSIINKIYNDINQSNVIRAKNKEIQELKEEIIRLKKLLNPSISPYIYLKGDGNG